MPADFIMFALVHFIIAAEAGETAKATTTAAAINILILDLASGEETSDSAGSRGAHLPRRTFREEDNFSLQLRRSGLPDQKENPCSHDDSKNCPSLKGAVSGISGIPPSLPVRT